MTKEEIMKTGKSEPGKKGKEPPLKKGALKGHEDPETIERLRHGLKPTKR